MVSYTCLFLPNSDSPYSEHGTLEEVDQDAGTEPHTSEDGKSRLVLLSVALVWFGFFLNNRVPRLLLFDLLYSCIDLLLLPFSCGMSKNRVYMLLKHPLL